MDFLFSNKTVLEFLHNYPPPAWDRILKALCVYGIQNMRKNHSIPPSIENLEDFIISKEIDTHSLSSPYQSPGHYSERQKIPEKNLQRMNPVPNFQRPYTGPFLEREKERSKLGLDMREEIRTKSPNKHKHHHHKEHRSHRDPRDHREHRGHREYKNERERIEYVQRDPKNKEIRESRHMDYYSPSRTKSPRKGREQSKLETIPDLSHQLMKIKQELEKIGKSIKESPEKLLGIGSHRHSRQHTSRDHREHRDGSPKIHQHQYRHHPSREERAGQFPFKEDKNKQKHVQKMKIPEGENLRASGKIVHNAGRRGEDPNSRNKTLGKHLTDIPQDFEREEYFQKRYEDLERAEKKDKEIRKLIYPDWWGNQDHEEIKQQTRNRNVPNQDTFDQRIEQIYKQDAHAPEQYKFIPPPHQKYLYSNNHTKVGLERRKRSHDIVKRKNEYTHSTGDLEHFFRDQEQRTAFKPSIRMDYDLKELSHNSPSKIGPVPQVYKKVRAEEPPSYLGMMAGQIVKGQDEHPPKYAKKGRKKGEKKGSKRNKGGKLTGREGEDERRKFAPSQRIKPPPKPAPRERHIPKYLQTVSSKIKDDIERDKRIAHHKNSIEEDHEHTQSLSPPGLIPRKLSEEEYRASPTSFENPLNMYHHYPSLSNQYTQKPYLEDPNPFVSLKEPMMPYRDRDTFNQMKAMASMGSMGSFDRIPTYEKTDATFHMNPMSQMDTLPHQYFQSRASKPTRPSDHMNLAGSSDLFKNHPYNHPPPFIPHPPPPEKHDRFHHPYSSTNPPPIPVGFGEFENRYIRPSQREGQNTQMPSYIVPPPQGVKDSRRMPYHENHPRPPPISIPGENNEGKMKEREGGLENEKGKMERTQRPPSKEEEGKENDPKLTIIKEEESRNDDAKNNIEQNSHFISLESGRMENERSYDDRLYQFNNRDSYYSPPFNPYASSDHFSSTQREFTSLQ